MTQKWWIAVVKANEIIGIFGSSEPGFLAARALAKEVTTADEPAILRPAVGAVEVAPYALQQHVTIEAPATEVGSR